MKNVSIDPHSMTISFPALPHPLPMDIRAQLVAWGEKLMHARHAAETSAKGKEKALAAVEYNNTVILFEEFENTLRSLYGEYVTRRLIPTPRITTMKELAA